MHGETLSLPERRNGVFFGVETVFIVAQNKGCAIGTGELSGGGSDERHDFGEGLCE
jgi:hypothetical protein